MYSDYESLPEDPFLANPSSPKTNSRDECHPCIKYSYTLLMMSVVYLGMAAMMGFWPFIPAPPAPPPPACGPNCAYDIVESFPSLTEPIIINETRWDKNGTLPETLRTAQTWIDLFGNATSTIDLSVFYFNIIADNTTDPAFQIEDGQAVFDALVAAAQRDIKIRMLISKPQEGFPVDQSPLLVPFGVNRREIDMTDFYETGVNHAKYIIVDGKTTYIGSANFDWKSFTQVKEIGILIEDCPCMADDLTRAFQNMWERAESKTLPNEDTVWSPKVIPAYNKDSPAEFTLNGDIDANAYFTVSPPEFAPPGRTSDLDAILDILYSARESVSIEVMDFDPLIVYGTPLRYWGTLADGIKSAAWAGADVNLMVGIWNWTRPETFDYLSALQVETTAAAGNVSVGLFYIPEIPDVEPMDHARVNHAKFCVSESQAWIGTSNWGGDYFVNTIGNAFVTSTPELVSVVQDIFDRDWMSPLRASLPLPYRMCPHFPDEKCYADVPAPPIPPGPGPDPNNTSINW